MRSTSRDTLNEMKRWKRCHGVNQSKCVEGTSSRCQMSAVIGKKKVAIWMSQSFGIFDGFDGLNQLGNVQGGEFGG